MEVSTVSQNLSTPEPRGRRFSSPPYARAAEVAALFIDDTERLLDRLVCESCGRRGPAVGPVVIGQSVYIACTKCAPAVEACDRCGTTEGVGTEGCVPLCQPCLVVRVAKRDFGVTPDPEATWGRLVGAAHVTVDCGHGYCPGCASPDCQCPCHQQQVTA